MSLREPENTLLRQPVVVIRHGMITPPKDSEGNDLMYPTDIPLNALGQLQAESLARNLLEKGILLSQIHTSPYTRALQYASIIARRMGSIPVIQEYELRDPDIPGYIGVPTREIDNIDIYSNPRSDDQETYEHMATRMERIFYKLLEQSGKNPFGIVSHGDPIQVLMRRLRHPQEAIDFLPRMDELRKLQYLQRGDAWIISLENNIAVSIDHLGHGYQFSS